MTKRTEVFYHHNLKKIGYRKSTGMSVINSLNWCINKQKNSASNGGNGSNSNMTNTNTNTGNLESEGFMTTEGRGPRSDA